MSFWTKIVTFFCIVTTLLVQPATNLNAESWSATQIDAHEWGVHQFDWSTGEMGKIELPDFMYSAQKYRQTYQIS